jgi:uncharacterized Fe-S radical SAM superfamily protein PflX
MCSHWYESYYPDDAKNTDIVITLLYKVAKLRCCFCRNKEISSIHPMKLFRLAV